MEKKYYRILIELQFIAEDEDEAIDEFIEEWGSTLVTETDWIVEEAPELEAIYGKEF